MASATHHGNWFALADGLKDKLVRNDPLDELGGLAPITAQAQHLFMFGVYAFFGADVVATARTELMGWAVSPTMTSSRASLRELGRAVVEQLKKLGEAN